MSELHPNLAAYVASNGLAVDAPKAAVRLAINEYLKTALATNRTFLAIATPTAAQVGTQVTRLTRQVTRLERLLLNDMSGEE